MSVVIQQSWQTHQGRLMTRNQDFVEKDARCFFYGVIRYEVIRCEVIRYEVIRYEAIRYEVICYEVIRCEVIRYEVIHYEVLHYEVIRYNVLHYEGALPQICGRILNPDTGASFIPPPQNEGGI